MRPLDRLCEQIIVFCGLEGHIDARQFPQLPSPQARAIDDDLRLDFSLWGDDTGDAPVFLVYPDDLSLFKNLYAPILAPFASAMVTSTGLARPSSGV